MRFRVILLLIAALLTGCSGSGREAEKGEHEAIQRTVWTQATELFLEYELPRPGGEASFLAHVTVLKEFKPLSDAVLSMTFTPASGAPFTLTIDKPKRPGIYEAKVPFKLAGIYTLKVSYTGKMGADTITVPGIGVGNDDEKDHQEPHDADKGGEKITFLKEQQWIVEFMTGLLKREPVAAMLTVAGEIVSAPSSDVVVASPLAGTIADTAPFAHLGMQAAKNEALAVIKPPIGQQGGLGSLNASYAEAKSRLTLAEQEYERAKRLYEAKAVPKRRLDEAELARTNAEAVFAPLDASMRDMKESISENRVVVRSPLTGTVAEVFVASGKAVEAGQQLFRIVNASTVWLKAHVPATELGNMRNVGAASFTVQGLPGTFKPSRLVAGGNVVDSRTRTVPMLFEVKNDGNILKVGMFADVMFTTGREENALTAPEDALFEDEGRYFVYVQKNGESFERREVKTGLRGVGSVQILFGVREGERIVLKGGYYVKLASLSSRMPDAHAGHAH
jgi:RND family efflux transporter MFP subunit